MIRRLPSSALVVVLGLVALSCRSGYMKKTDALAAPDASHALVVFLRPGSGESLNILDGRFVIGNSMRNSQFGYLATPGRHLFVSIGGDAGYMEADLRAGLTYYVIVTAMDRKQDVGYMLSPAAPGTPEWTEAIALSKSLKRYAANEEAIKRWGAAVQWKLDYYHDQYDAAEKSKKDWPVLKAEYGV